MSSRPTDRKAEFFPQARVNVGEGDYAPGFQFVDARTNRTPRVVFFQRLHRAVVKIAFDEDVYLPGLIVFNLNRAAALFYRVALFLRELGGHRVIISH